MKSIYGKFGKGNVYPNRIDLQSDPTLMTALFFSLEELLELHQEGTLTIREEVYSDFLEAYKGKLEPFVEKYLSQHLPVARVRDMDYKLVFLSDIIYLEMCRPIPPDSIELSKIESTGDVHLNFVLALHAAFRKLVQMQDEGKIEIDMETDVREVAKMDPKIVIRDGEKTFTANFLGYFEEVSDNLEQFFTMCDTQYDLHISEDHTTVTAKPHW